MPERFSVAWPGGAVQEPDPAPPAPFGMTPTKAAAPFSFTDAPVGPDERERTADLEVTKSPSSTPARPPDRLMAEQALAAIANPRALAGRLATMEEHRDEIGKESDAAQAEVRRRLETRRGLEDQALDAILDYRAGLNATRPEIPALQKPPKMGDVQVRPWLDPEGKSVLSVIAQTLGMLATGISGLVVGAPKTALRQFREAADAWRQDETDRAQSNWQKFQGTMATIEAENRQALTVYELKDREYGSNVLAKRAAVIATLDSLKLHDASMQAALLPFDLAIQGHQQQLDATVKIIAGANQYAAIMERYARHSQGIPTSFWTAFGELSGIQESLKIEKDPARRAQLQTRANVLESAIKGYQQKRVEYAQAQGGIGIAKTQLPKIQGRIDMVSRMVDRVEALDDAYRTLEKKGLLPGTPSALSEWGAKAQRLFPGRWDAQAKEAYGVVQNFFSQVNVTEARTILDEVGTRFKAAFGHFSDNPMMPYDTWAGIRKQMAAMLGDADHTYRAHERLYLQSLGQPARDESGGSDDGEE